MQRCSIRGWQIQIRAHAGSAPGNCVSEHRTFSTIPVPHTNNDNDNDNDTDTDTHTDTHTDTGTHSEIMLSMAVISEPQPERALEVECRGVPRQRHFNAPKPSARRGNSELSQPQELLCSLLYGGEHTAGTAWTQLSKYQTTGLDPLFPLSYCTGAPSALTGPHKHFSERPSPVTSSATVGTFALAGSSQGMPTGKVQLESLDLSGRILLRTHRKHEQCNCGLKHVAVPDRPEAPRIEAAHGRPCAYLMMLVLSVMVAVDEEIKNPSCTPQVSWPASSQETTLQPCLDRIPQQQEQAGRNKKPHK